MVYWVGGGRGGNHLTTVGFKAKFFTCSFAGYLISKPPCASYRTYCTKCVKNSSIKILGGGGVFVKMYLTCTIKLKSPNWGYCVERQTVPVDKIFKIFW